MSRNLQEELPDEVEDRAKSIKEDNPDMDKSTAIAIARDQLNMAAEYENISLEEDPCEDGWVMVGTKQQDGQTVPNCVPAEDADEADLATLAEYEEGEAVAWDWQGTTVYGRVSEVREEDGETIYVIDEYDDEAGGFQSGNVTKSEDSSISEADKEIPDRTDENMLAADCPENHAKVNGECIPVEEVDTPVSVLSAPDKRVMASASPLDTQPIEREELSNGSVAYRNIKLLDEGVWKDKSSRTPTLYDKRTFENLSIESPQDMDGPPVNVAHDLDSNGEPNEASVGGYIDPESVDTDGKALFGDIVLDQDDSAGAYLDENLKSSLESNGEVGFSPSVELMPTELEASNHPQAEEHVMKADLTGTALVRDPASKSVDFAHETRNRQIAMGLEGQTAKRLDNGTINMANAEEVRETLDSAGLGDVIEDMTDEEVMSMAENLHSDLMNDLEGEAVEAESDGEEEEEEEDEKEMAEIPEEFMADFEEMANRVQTLEETVEELRDGMMDESELEDATEELAEASDVEAIEKTLEAIVPEDYSTDEVARALEAVGEEPKKPRTMSDKNTDEEYSGRIVGVSDPSPY